MQESPLKAGVPASIYIIIYRLCYVTTNAMMRRETFLRELNHSYRLGSLGGQLNDKELAGYVAFKKRQHGPFHSLHAVVNVGKQENGTWVLNRDMFFDREGQTRPVSCCAEDTAETTKQSCILPYLSL